MQLLVGSNQLKQYPQASKMPINTICHSSAHMSLLGSLGWLSHPRFRTYHMLWLSWKCVAEKDCVDWWWDYYVFYSQLSKNLVAPRGAQESGEPCDLNAEYSTLLYSTLSYNGLVRKNFDLYFTFIIFKILAWHDTTRYERKGLRLEDFRWNEMLDLAWYNDPFYHAR